MQRLRFALELPGVPVERLRAFHGSPEALEVLTPPGTLVRVEGDLGPLHNGQRLTLRLRQFGLPLAWEAVNEEVSAAGFTDHMVKGPFRAWIHRHRFEATAGGSRLVDEVEFQLPFWPLSLPVLPLVRRDLRRLFAFRHAATLRRLSPSP
jgi:ligand-binding SRPBCC domain-containing protein